MDPALPTHRCTWAYVAVESALVGVARDPSHVCRLVRFAVHFRDLHGTLVARSKLSQREYISSHRHS